MNYKPLLVLQKQNLAVSSCAGFSDRIFCPATPLVNGHKVGILSWVLETLQCRDFLEVVLILRGWRCFLYITDGYPVYRCFINDLDYLVSKIVMTRVEAACRQA